ncbi:MAG: C39 family peptidase [Negativicutes bacterium]|nr:C39 family peptidase [Negativicutes bacterium]
MRRKLFLYTLVLIVVLGVGSSATQMAERTVAMQGNLLVQTGSADFAAGTTDGTAVLRDEAGPLRLAIRSGKYLTRGTYVSPVIQTAPFRDLIISWNADTPAGTTISVEAQVLVEQKWSEWFSWGTWGDRSASAATVVSRMAKMDIDTLSLQGEKKATAVRYRVNLMSRDPKVTPTVRLVALTIRDQGKIQRVPLQAETAGNGWERNLPVPAYSQGRRDPKIASRICSPTSVSMVLNYHGVVVSPEEAAWGSYDHKGDLFGNWSFNAAFAGKRGLTSYVAFMNSITDLKQEIAQGYPVVAAVNYRNSETVKEALPVLHGAPVEATDGHLVVVRGFKVKDGKEYVLVNDPAGPDDAGVYREYLATEFEAAWAKVAYIIRPGADAVSGKK